MDKILELYTYTGEGVQATPFPDANGDPIEIGAFRYDAKRMGGAPTITASVNYASCLDDEWTDNVYAMFNGEKFYLKQIPTSSYNNTSAMYKHDIELVSERVALDNVYFFDVVTDGIIDDDKPVSNSTKVVFFGDVREFANRLKASLQYSALDYDVVVDTGVTSEEKLISFEDQFFSNVLQEIYNTYEVPYYFEGKTIHIGYSKPNEELPSFAYGVDDALLSITKNNANYKIVNRATGTGSSENIPYYYPNNSPKGNIRAELNTTSDDFSINVVDLPTFADKIDLDGDIEAKMVSLSVSRFMLNDEEYTLNHMPQEHVTVNYYQIFRDNVSFVAYSNSAVKGKCSFTIRIAQGDSSTGVDASKYMAKIHVGDKTLDPISVVDDKINFEIEVNFEKAGNKEILAEVALSYIPQGQSSIRRAYNVVAGSGLGWFYKDKVIELKNVGIKHQGTPNEGDKITQKLIEHINTSQSLMPSKYRDTKGVERFYNATNDTYEGVTFNNPFVAGKPKEHIVKIEDIKPSIEGMLVNGERIDMFEAFAYDKDDNDETYEDEKGNVYFKHPYFFAKLKPLGFNLFDHAIEQQPMTISFTSGACGACNFEIAVDEESQKNTVQVDENGNVKRDQDGNVLCGSEALNQSVEDFQDIQQDTTDHSVWIALRKEEETYGILMPKAPINGAGGHRPTTDDTFVILGINLPDEYILNAERRLEAEIIKYLQDNNDEKFTFSIGFSRIYFAENEDVLNSLNENSKIQITYDNKTYDLYVSSFSYTMSESDALPEIKVELDETLKTSQNAIQKAINEVKTTLGSAINEVSQGVAMQRRSYVSKVQDDTAMGVVDFSKGVKFGEGGKVEILDNNSAKLTIEYLEVTKKATFTSLEIQEKTHVGGQMLVTPASMNCGEVEEFEGFYRCYFQTKGADGSEEIFNQFVVGDQAICQTFNAWGSKYYWRLVVGVGEDYVDLSKEDCDEGSGVPEAGDRIIQMGNREDEARQNAIVIAAHGDNSPYIVQYKGINNFDLPKTDNDTRITTLLSPTKNILTGQVKMVAGSSGLELFEEWAEKQELIDSKASGEDFDKFKSLVDKDIENIKKQVDGAITTWFYDATPTLDNAPAVDWITDDDKNNHLGDLYYSGEGKAYRFQYDEATTTYYWNLIEDEDITEALGLARQAKDTADGKRRVFVVQPTPPYDEGDLWSRGSTMPMMVCVNTKTSGSFAEGDWDFADNAGQLEEQIAGYEYIKEAIQNGSTIVTGGLIQSGVLMLGYTNANGQYQVMSGTNGVYNASALGGGIAAWYGGVMEEGVANAIIRFDGSGYFAKGNLSWDNKGGASFADGKITITPQGALIFSDDIAFGSNENETVASIIQGLSTVLSYFTLDDAKTTLTSEYNLVIEGDVASGGDGQDTPGGSGGVSEEDVLDILEKNNYITSADLSSYYTKGESDARYLAQSGGTLLGSLQIGSDNNTSYLDIGVKRNNVYTYMATTGAGEGYIGVTFANGNYAGITIIDSLDTLYYNHNSVYKEIIHSGNIGSQSVNYATEAGTLSGYERCTNGASPSWERVPFVGPDGVMDIGKYIDFRNDSTLHDFSTRLLCTGKHSNVVYLPSASGTLALTDSNVASATKLATARTIWGQSFDGTNDVLAGSGVGIMSSKGNYYGLSILPTSSPYWGVRTFLTYDEGSTMGAYEIASRNSYGLTISHAGGVAYDFGNIPSDLSYDVLVNIRPNGNVLIGTMRDASRLTVSAKYRNALPSLGSLSDNSDMAIHYDGDSAGYGMYFSINGYTGASTIQVGRNDGNNSAYNLLLNPLGGNVGIGTADPLSKLQVGGQINVSHNSNKNYAFISQDDYTSNTSWMKLGTCYGYQTEAVAMTIYKGMVKIGNAIPTCELDVNGGIKATKPIFGYMYGTNNNAAAFIFDKPGLNYTGIGSDGVSDTIRFGACDINGTWVSYNQKWKFYGDVIVTGDVASA